MLDLNGLACDADRLRCADYGVKSFFGMVVHAYFVLSRRVLDHLRVGRERVKRQQDCQRGDFGANSFGQGDAVLDGLPGEVRAVRWYRDVGIPRFLLDRSALAPAHSKSHFASCLRIDNNSLRCFALVLG